MRELPRQLSATSWRSSSRAGRASSSGWRRRRTRSPGPTTLVDELPDEDKVEALAAHPRIGATACRLGAEQGPSDPEVLAELAAAEPRLRGAARLPLRRLREPAAEVASSCRCCASGSQRRATRSWTTALRELVAIARRSHGASASTRTCVDWLDLLVPLPARHRGDRLDRHARSTSSRSTTISGRAGGRARDLAGESWEIHGGGFYRIEKFRVAPDAAPEPLHWYKWEAYTTWLSGFALFVVLYYLHAGTYLIDADRRGHWPAVAISHRAARRRVARLRRALPARSDGATRDSAPACSCSSLRRSASGSTSSRRAPRSCRSARCSGRSWSRTSSS